MSLKTAQQLNHSKPLDVHTWSDYAEVNQFVNILWDQFLAEQYLDRVGRGKRPLTSVKQQFKVLLLDLYVTWKTDSDLVIGVAMSNSAYQTSSRYNALHISPIMIDLVNSLVEMGLIEKHVGSELSGITTRIWTTPKLIQYFKGVQFSRLQINTHQDQEVIILNKGDFESVDEETGEITTVSRQAKPVEYDDEDFEDIPKMREEINKYNELLRTSFIDIGHLEQPVVVQPYWDRRKNCWKERRVQINHHNKFVRRVFYRGSWTLGGRVHGGFWQQIKKKESIY